MRGAEERDRKIASRRERKYEKPVLNQRKTPTTKEKERLWVNAGLLRGDMTKNRIDVGNQRERNPRTDVIMRRKQKEEIGPRRLRNVEDQEGGMEK